MLVRKKGLEPPRREALEPKSSASTNSATFARKLLEYFTAIPFAARDFTRTKLTITVRKCLFCQYNSAKYLSAEAVPVDHYENFPVASWLLPAALRHPIETIYAFARTADDFADEGVRTPAERLGLLDGYCRELDLIAAGTPSKDALFQALDAVIAEHNLPIQLFHDLLDAFKQDINKSRYETFGELMDYCRRSANPIGRLLLHLYRKTSPQNLAWSDSICSALQLINHWQDVAIDYAKIEGGRIYLPQEDLAKFGLGTIDISTRTRSPAWKDLMAFQCARARDLLNSGKPLGKTLPGRIGAELRTIIAGGAAILNKIDEVNGDVFRHRPSLTKWDWIKIGPKAILAI